MSLALHEHLWRHGCAYLVCLQTVWLSEMSLLAGRPAGSSLHLRGMQSTPQSDQNPDSLLPSAAFLDMGLHHMHMQVKQR